MFVAALRRLFTLLIVAAAVTGAASLLVGLPTGAGASRSISVGYYLLGSFLLIAGFFVGNRGPARLKRDDEGNLPLPFFATRRLRWATVEEREDALNTSAIFVTLGFLLIVLGVLADNRYALF